MGHDHPVSCRLLANVPINGDTAAIEGTGRYKELGTFANLWTVTFDRNGRCTVFRMWNNQV
ncbi:hypothetical protein [Streptacidiphilus sp. MAP5-3]|uniref:hypothetical protein n=1 Tax=unclassified Streptacidiphilus TaxID=2643834 RepID=UPI003512661C